MSEEKKKSNKRARTDAKPAKPEKEKKKCMDLSLYGENAASSRPDVIQYVATAYWFYKTTTGGLPPLIVTFQCKQAVELSDIRNSLEHAVNQVTDRLVQNLKANEMTAEERKVFDDSVAAVEAEGKTPTKTPLDNLKAIVETIKMARRNVELCMFQVWVRQFKNGKQVTGVGQSILAATHSAGYSQVV